MKGMFLKELKKALKIAPVEYILLILASIIIRALLLIIPVVFSYAINYITVQKYNTAIVLLFSLLAITLVYRIFEGLYIVAYYNVYNKLYYNYTKTALSKTNDNSLFSLSRFSVGEYANITITDIDVISTFLTTGVIRAIQIVEFLVIYVYFFSLDIVIFIPAILLSIIMVFVAIKYGNVLQKVNEKRKKSLDSMTAGIYSFFNNIREIKNYNLFEKHSETSYEGINDYLKKNSKYSIHYNISNNLFLYIFELFRVLSVLYGLLLVQRGQFEVGTLLIIYNYYQKIIDNFTSILTTNVDYRNVKVSLNRFNKIIEYSKEKENGIKISNNEINGSITINKILYGFKDNPMLKNASMKVKENSITVITGRDEAAQNGVYDLLLKLNRQHEGEIKIDDYNINDIDDDSYYKLISCARRQSNLFETSIKNNLLTINDNFDKAIAISKEIGLDEKINKLPKGYKTVLDDSTPISQNTRMLIIIARCLLKNAKIILLDDIMDSLNKESEQQVLDVLESLKENHTIVIISNSKDIINKADQVIAINNKTISKSADVI